MYIFLEMDIFYLDSWNPVINEKQFDGFTRDTGIESVVRLKVFRYYLDFFLFFQHFIVLTVHLDQQVEDILMIELHRDV